RPARHDERSSASEVAPGSASSPTPPSEMSSSALVGPATPASASQAEPDLASRRSVAVRPSSPGSASPRPSASGASVTSPPAAAPVAERTASLGVTTSKNRWGHVRIDNVPVGDSPVAPRALAPGRHVVSIVTEQGEQQERTVELAPGDKTQVRFEF